MIGASAEVVFADAYVKGIRGFDAEGAYTMLRAAATRSTKPIRRADVAAAIRRRAVHGSRLRTSVGRRLFRVSWTIESGQNDVALADLRDGAGARETTPQTLTSRMRQLTEALRSRRSGLPLGRDPRRQLGERRTVRPASQSDGLRRRPTREQSVWGPWFDFDTARDDGWAAKTR